MFSPCWMTTPFPGQFKVWKWGLKRAAQPRQPAAQVAELQVGLVHHQLTASSVAGLQLPVNPRLQIEVRQEGRPRVQIGSRYGQQSEQSHVVGGQLQPLITTRLRLQWAVSHQTSGEAVRCNGRTEQVQELAIGGGVLERDVDSVLGQKLPQLLQLPLQQLFTVKTVGEMYEEAGIDLNIGRNQLMKLTGGLFSEQ